MLDRRQLIITASGALISAALPAQADQILYTQRKGTIVRDLAYEEPWHRELCWIPGNSGSIGHTWTSHISGKTIWAMCSQYRTIEPGELDTALFNGLPAYDDHLPFHGLRDHYNTRDRNKAQNAVNVLDGGSRGDMLGSVYLVCWSPKLITLATPSVAPDGQPANPWKPYKATLCIQDWRYAMRIANLDMIEIAQHPRPLWRLMDRAIDLAPTHGGERAFYVPSAVRAAWHQRERIDSYHMIPIRGVNALNFTEETV